MSETAKFAKVVLPGASYFERNGTFTNGERRVQRANEVIPQLGDNGKRWPTRESCVGARLTAQFHPLLPGVFFP